VRELRHARDLRSLGRDARPLLQSPAAFSGTLEELAERYILPNTPSPAAVVGFHERLEEYLRTPDPLLIVRYVRDIDRGRICTTADGTRFKAADNAPVWWIHYALVQDCRIAPGAFGAVMDSLPTHLFEISATLKDSANAAGWHFAHIFAVKDRSTDYRRWTRADAIARFVRNVHPCNYFLLPKPEWQRWGADERVIGWFAELFAERYREVWARFLELSRADASQLARVRGPIRYEYSSLADASVRVRAGPGTVERRPRTHKFGDDGVVTYSASRLTFKRDVIEQLEDHERFRVVTPHGTFEMTREDFRREFDNVARSASYREARVYNYSVVPRKALRFRSESAEADLRDEDPR
jgi:hypothetical protein